MSHLNIFLNVLGYHKDLIQENEYLTYLILSGNEMDSGDIIELGQCLNVNKYLKNITLGYYLCYFLR